VAERQVSDGAVLSFEQRGVLGRDRKGGRQMLAVRDHGALGVACGARGVDNEGRLLRPQLGHLLGEPGKIAVATVPQ